VEAIATAVAHDLPVGGASMAQKWRIFCLTARGLQRISIKQVGRICHNCRKSKETAGRRRPTDQALDPKLED
jgi:hypothetical protein